MDPETRTVSAKDCGGQLECWCTSWRTLSRRLRGANGAVGGQLTSSLLAKLQGILAEMAKIGKIGAAQVSPLGARTTLSTCSWARPGISLSLG